MTIKRAVSSDVNMEAMLMKTASSGVCYGLKRTVLLRSIGSILLGFVIASCSEESKTRPEQTIVIRGSNTFGEELAPRLVAEYKKAHPSVEFDLEFKATSYGIGSLMVGKCDIAAASRTLSTNEFAMGKANNVDFSEYPIGSYNVSVIVNSGNAVADLTKDQVRDIFIGAVQNWKDVGGPDAPIHLYIRDPVSGTYLGFRELAMENKPYALGVKGFTDYAGIVQAVGQDANGIGYSSIIFTSQSSVKAVSIGGVAPTLTTMKQGQYPYVRILRLYTDKAKEPALAHDFIQFVESAPGQQILTDMGYIPRP
jgi:phosphate transport system substrate-binding protein